MTKAELIERIARSRNLPPDITKKDVAQILGIAFEELATYFAKTRVTQKSAPRFTFPRFGTFTKKRRSARRGVNPRTLEPIQIDACHTLDFKASRELRESMNGQGTTAASSRGTGPGRSSTRAKVKSKKRAAKPSATPTVKTGDSASPTSRRRKLTPRDEDAELDALIDDDGLFEELPSTRMQRVRPKRDRKSRRTG